MVSYDVAAAALSLQSPGANLNDADLQVAKAPLAAFDRLKLQPFSVALPLAVKLDGAQMDKLTLARTQAGSPLLALDSTILNDLAMGSAQLNINNIQLAGAEHRSDPG